MECASPPEAQRQVVPDDEAYFSPGDEWRASGGGVAAAEGRLWSANGLLAGQRSARNDRRFAFRITHSLPRFVSPRSRSQVCGRTSRWQAGLVNAGLAISHAGTVDAELPR